MISRDSTKTLVQTYLHEVLDNGRVELLGGLFTPDCVIHRPEFPEPIVGLENYKAFLTLGFTTIIHRMETTIHDMVIERDRVACRLSHDVVFYPDAVLPSRIGAHDVGGREVTWSALALCRLRNGKVAEEWVCKDDLGILIRLDVLTGR